MKLVMLGELRPNCGSIDAFHGYTRAARRQSVSLRIADTRKTTPSWIKEETAGTDFVLFVVEHALNTNHRGLISAVPKRKRVLVDVDANLTIGEPILRSYLREAFPTILQPTTRLSKHDILPFPFFGYDLPLKTDKSPVKSFDLVYVGNNWFRWQEMRTLVDECRSSCASRALRIGLFGKWWTAWRPRRLAYAVITDRCYLANCGIRVHRAVSHAQVSHRMSLGRVNAVLQRKPFREERIITPRLFETVAADTFPLFYAPADMLEQLYGPVVREFLPHPQCGFGGRFQDMLRRPNHYRDALMTLRAVSHERHSYESRLTDLIVLLEERKNVVRHA